ncbi:MAG: CDP-glycerol glycerophosphotransferase family protein, partial [Nitrososphaerales archaeon]
LLFPIPDRMCVWSKISEQNLTEIAKFPPTVPVVTGDPKSDFLPEAIKAFNRSEILQKHGIPETCKVVLYATENLPSQEEKLLVTRSVLGAVKAISGCYLMIKIHPIETDIGFYERSATESGLKNFSILKDVNLYELLYASDVIVLSYSTVAAEAMRMGKPVISLNLMGLHDNVPFVKNRVALVVNHSGDLHPSIQKCLEKPPDIEEIVVRAKSFAEEQLGAADGMATERVVRTITELCKNYERNVTPGEGAIGG